jgi:hypothetical protein
MTDPTLNAKTEEMQRAIGLWILGLNKVAGWQEWRLASMGRQLYYDDDLPAVLPDAIPDEFIFPPEIERQHAVVMGFLNMRQTVNALKEVEYYFRRFPFRGLPVSRDGHFTNVCEMYFARFYEFEERMKGYFDALKHVVAIEGRAVGGLIKQYSKEFDSELRARHDVHHRERFSDLVSHNLFVTLIASDSDHPVVRKNFERRHRSAYRKATREWVIRVRERSARMEAYVNGIAEATLNICPFLSDLLEKDALRNASGTRAL